MKGYRRGKNSSLPRETRLEILRRLDQGENPSEIASALNISENFVWCAIRWREHVIAYRRIRERYGNKST